MVKTHKVLLVSAILAATGFASMAANAVEPQSYAIQLKAEIPAETFYVTPVDSGWINTQQELPYDLSTKTLGSLTKLFQAKNSAGGIQASLSNTNSGGKAQLFNGVTPIPLKVTFNGIEVTGTAVKVLTKAEAAAGSRMNLVIEPNSGTTTGLYQILCKCFFINTQPVVLDIGS